MLLTLLKPQASGAVDPYFSNVSLLLKNTLADSSTYAHSVNTSGGANITTTDVKYGAGALNFPASSNVTVPSNAAFALGTGDFTIEAWVDIDTWSFTYADFAAIFNIGNYLTGLQVRLQPYSIQYYSGGDGFLAATDLIPTGSYFHLAITRQSGTVRIWRDGVQQGFDYTSTSNIAAGNVLLGMAADNVNEYLVGKLDDVRFTTGVARYSTTFTPPTGELYSPPSGVAGTFSALEDADTFSGTGTLTSVAQGTLDSVEAGSDSLSAGGLVLVDGDLAGSEIGTDTANFSGAVLVSGALSAVELGADSFAGSGSVALAGVSGALAATEDTDTAAMVGAVIVQGALAATEPADIATMVGSVTVQGALAATEPADIATMVGSVTVQGALAATEPVDTAAIVGVGLAQGNLAATETADTAAMLGTVLVKGAVSATEAADIAAFIGSVTVQGALAATEASTDFATITGGVASTGSFAATETASDSATATGLVIVAGAMSATEDQSDTAFAVGGAIAAGNLVGVELADSAAFTGIVRVVGSAAATEFGFDGFEALGSVSFGVTTASIWGYQLANGLSAGQTLVELHAMLQDLHRIHGLNPETPLTVTTAQRTAGVILQTIISNGDTTTVARQ